MSSYYEKMLATGEVKCIDEEIPFDVPNGWEWCRICHVAEIARGGSPRPIKEYLTDATDGINWIKIGDTEKDSKYITSVKERIKQSGVSKSRMVHKGDFLLTNSMSFGRPYITQVDGCIHDGWLVISLIEQSYRQDFFYYLLSSGYAYSQFAKRVAGAVVQNLNSEKVAISLFPLPPYKEQNRIVQKIKDLLPLVEKFGNDKTLLDKLNADINTRLKKSILQEAIQGKLVPQIAEEGTAQELLEQIKKEKQKLVKEGKLKKSTLATSVIFRGDDNKYWEKKGTTCECIDEDIPFDIPKSWAWARLETILNTGSARRVHAKDWRQAGIPFYRAREIGKLADDGFVDNELYIDLSLYEAFSSSGVPLPNDLMITAVGTLGKVYIVKENDKFYYKDGSVLCLANKYGLCAEYLKMVIESPSFKGQYRQESQGTTVATLTMVRLQKYFIPLPPLQEQYRIVETYRNIASIMSR